MLPWTSSKWFRRGVTGLSTVFVAIVLATSLMAEGSALKRADVEYEAIDCKKEAGEAGGRARPAQGCKRKKRVVIPISDKQSISEEELERALDELPPLKGPRGLAGARGRDGKRGATGARGPQGVGRPGRAGRAGARGAAGSR